MIDWKKHILLIIGVFLIIASAFLLAWANSKQAACESLGGQIVRFLDAEKQAGCNNLKIWLGVAYAGLAIGVTASITNFVRRTNDKRRTRR